MTAPPDAASILDRLFSTPEFAPLGGGWSAAQWSAALEDAIEEQLSDYGRLLLPTLGLGERVEFAACELVLDGRRWRQSDGELWYFDGRYPQSWIHAALLIPFEQLDNWLALVHRDEVDEALARALRPPMVPRLKNTLASLEWIVADFGGYDGGRLQRAEFLELVGDRRWVRIEHHGDDGTVHVQRWQGGRVEERWSASVYETFGCEYQPGTANPSPRPVQLAEPWRFEPERDPVGTVACLDIICDVYWMLRRFVDQRFGLDVDRLGPHVLWRDVPDELVEFSDRDDAVVGDVCALIAETLALPTDQVREVVLRWWDAMCAAAPVIVPALGTLRRVQIPALTFPSPMPQAGGELERLAGQSIFIIENEASRPRFEPL